MFLLKKFHLFLRYDGKLSCTSGNIKIVRYIARCNYFIFISNKDKLIIQLDTGGYRNKWNCDHILTIGPLMVRFEKNSITPYMLYQIKTYNAKIPPVYSTLIMMLAYRYALRHIRKKHPTYHVNTKIQDTINMINKIESHQCLHEEYLVVGP